MLDKLKTFMDGTSLWAVVLFIAFIAIICLTVLKLLHKIYTSNSTNNNKFSKAILKDKEANLKSLNKKKRNKKQRTVDISSQQRELPSSADSSPSLANNLKGDAPTVENGELERMSNKKIDKKKGKSKKKKLVNDIITLDRVIPEAHSVVEEEGEWHTVPTKEQRSTRREKKRQDSVESNPVVESFAKPSTLSSLTPIYPTISSTAKDIAPRFARAAGEEWQEGANKRQVSSTISKPVPSIVNRSPMVPTSVLPPSTNWLPGTDGITDLLSYNTTVSINGFTTNPPSWSLSSNKAEGLPWSDSVGSNNWLSKSNNAAQPWDDAGSPNVEKSNWPVDKTDLGTDWVHVNTSPTRVTSGDDWAASADAYTQGLRQWSNIRAPGLSNPPPVATQDLIKRENFLLEPEGGSVSLDANDPWNIDDYEKEGDWSPPEASWSNPNDEWTAPTVPAKPQPTYFEESSEDEKISAGSNPALQPQVVVGAGSNFLSSQNVTASKKPRRRRRKKQTLEVAAPPIALTDDVVQTPISTNSPTIAPVKEDIATEPMHEPVAEAEWSVTKTSKKKKPRIRKDD